MGELARHLTVAASVPFPEVPGLEQPTVAGHLGSLVLGPARSLAAMFYGPLKAIPGWDAETLILAAVGLTGSGAVFIGARRVMYHASQREVLQIGWRGRGEVLECHCQRV